MANRIQKYLRALLLVRAHEPLRQTTVFGGSPQIKSIGVFV